MKNETAKAGAAFLAQLLSDPAVLEAIAPVLDRIGARIADATAQRINDRHANALAPQKDGLIPVADCCKQIKKSWPTFKKAFIDTGKLKILPAPPNADKRMKYVSAKAWALAIREVPMQVIRLKAA